MNRSIQFDPAARLEAIEAAVWYDDQRIGLGEEFLDAIELTLDLALRRRVPDSTVTDLDDVRRVRVRRFPYHLIFLISSVVIVVVAVMHERRRPTHWIDRLDE
ncbi:MAG: type II toxin-antitoxin system RelE/ParE family toxin [Ilumatobacteraceae bacterium]|nr:type II toxin-antitoxin system RelE/ParE family toxin [Ilumatobacteraceae bacterium]